MKDKVQTEKNTEELPLVSVVVITHKRHPEIVSRAIYSVVKQTYPKIEIIVVDDSPDSYALRDEVQKAAVQMNVDQYIRHERNQGACVARNTGMHAAKGQYIAFLDDDDEWLPEKIEKQLLLFNDDKIGLVYCDSYTKNEITGAIISESRKCYAGSVYEKLILENFIGSTSFPLLRKAAMESIGGFDPLMRSAQDFDVWLRIAQQWDVAYVSDPLVIYHIHNDKRITTNPEARISGQERLIQKNKEYLDHNKDARLLRQIKIAPEYARNGQLRKAIQVWGNAAFRQPLKLRLNTEILVRTVYYYFRR